MYQLTFFLIFSGVFSLSLFGCDMGSKSVVTASEIIKKNLRSPSSFTLISGKEMWVGKNTEGYPAYIVRIEYDAQNGFGAMIRDCNLLAITMKGDKYEKLTSRSISPCKMEPYNEAQMLESLRKFYYPHSEP